MTEKSAALTAAQERALAVIDEHGTSLVSMWTNMATNTVSHMAVSALYERGVVVRFMGTDGIYARRPGPPEP